ncbi:MAG TPA: hypothetical protein VMH32_00115 [Burkholderiales bacterium]|nr:hypothetical protein [Burkholderiales bacterium]
MHPVARATALVATVFLVACSSLGGGGESAPEAKPAAKKKSTASVKSVIKDNMIVPGKRIGPVSVGMSVSQLYDVMGEPTQTQKGHEQDHYVFEDLEVVVDDADESVSTVTTQSPDFATADGLKVGLSVLAVKAKLAKLSGPLLIREEGDTSTYYAGGMVVVVSGGQVKSIMVRATSASSGS